jgi:hypothetical protein
MWLMVCAHKLERPLGAEDLGTGLQLVVEVQRVRAHHHGIKDLARRQDGSTALWPSGQPSLGGPALPDTPTWQKRVSSLAVNAASLGRCARPDVAKAQRRDAAEA